MFSVLRPATDLPGRWAAPPGGTSLWGAVVPKRASGAATGEAPANGGGG